MTMKITKTGRGSERNDETLLFEWLNHEVPESIKLSYETMLNTNKFAGSLQTNQIMGVYLEPITFSGEFFGEYISINNSNKFEYITAKERSDQLSRLQGRIVKFWFEGIKQLVIIQKYEIDIKNYNHIEYTLTLQPHDIQLPINPIDVKQYLSKSFIQQDTTIEEPKEKENFGVGFLKNNPNAQNVKKSFKLDTKTQIKSNVYSDKQIKALEKEIADQEKGLEVLEKNIQLKEYINNSRKSTGKNFLEKKKDPREDLWIRNSNLERQLFGKDAPIPDPPNTPSKTIQDMRLMGKKSVL